ncbi:cupin domain-containing protein [Streptomyces sp. NPDC054887]
MPRRLTALAGTDVSTGGRTATDGRLCEQGPKTHFHKTISESFFILDGTVRLFNGGDWIDAKKGDFLFVPQGGLHAFRNDADAPAEMLMLFAPGAPREEYFEGLSQLADATDEERT